MNRKKKFPVNLVTFTEEILNEKLHLLCSDKSSIVIVSSVFSLNAGKDGPELLRIGTFFTRNPLLNKPFGCTLFVSTLVIIRKSSLCENDF